MVKIQGPQLHEMGWNEPTGTPEGYQLFLAQITSIVKFFGANWDKEMLRESAFLAYQENNFMTVPEVKLFITRVKTSKYESHKNFTPAVFMGWLTSFTHEILATRGAVNSYHWRDKPLSDDILFPKEDEAGNPIKYVTNEVIKTTVVKLTKRFKEIEIEQRKEAERIRRERKEALQRHRDQQIINLIEHDGSQGIAPDKHLMNMYFTALKRMEEK